VAGQVGDVHTGREGAAPRVGDHQSVVLEPLERFAHRGASHLQFARHMEVVDRLTGPDLQGDQPVPQGQVGAIGQ